MSTFFLFFSLRHYSRTFVLTMRHTMLDSLADVDYSCHCAFKAFLFSVVFFGAVFFNVRFIPLPFPLPAFDVAVLRVFPPQGLGLYCTKALTDCIFPGVRFVASPAFFSSLPLHPPLLSISYTFFPSLPIPPRLGAWSRPPRSIPFFAFRSR